jgi:hypothetical protein
MFIWFGSLALTYKLYDYSFAMLLAMLYGLSLLFDASAFVWRIYDILHYETQFSFLNGTLILNGLLIIVDIIQCITLIHCMVKIKEHVDKLNIGLEKNASSNLVLQLYKKKPFELIKAWGTMRICGVLEIFMVLLVLSLYALGLNHINTIFVTLNYLLIPHLFLWIGCFAISKGLLDKDFIIGTAIVYGICMLLDGMSFAWRLYIVIRCHLYGTLASCIWMTPFAWITILCTLALSILSLVQLRFGMIVSDYIDKEEDRLLPYVKRRLRVNLPKFFS